jgi:large subunit ribosomal protein L32e
MAKKEDTIKEFSSLKGVGKKKAELLYDSGLDSMDKLKKASIKDLTAIEGVNEKLAKELIDQLNKKTDTKKETKKTDKKEEKTKPKAAPKEKETKKPVPKKTEEPESETEKETKEEKEEVEEEKEEEEGYKVKIKPKISKEKQEKIRLRKQIKNRTPEFLREEWFRYKKIPRNWRRPDGMTSKMRINLKYRPSKVRIGFRGPKEARGLHSSGFEEVMVYNVNDLGLINKETQAARIGGSVGTRKRLEIEKKAEELEVRILNI